LAIAKVASDWIVTPSTTSTDDVTYSFTVDANDGCNSFVNSSMSTPFLLHVGCPTAAATSDTYTFIGSTAATTTL
jgi:hypothetical protein